MNKDLLYFQAVIKLNAERGLVFIKQSRSFRLKTMARTCLYYLIYNYNQVLYALLIYHNMAGY